MVRLLAVLALLASCTVSVSFEDATFACSDGVCPDGLQCIEGFCTSDIAPDLGERRRLVFDHSAGSAPLVDFPLPVRIDADLASAIAAGGSDLRFTTLEGTALPHEIERWDASGESLVWLKVPLIEPFADGGEALMIYGEPDAVDSQAPAELWADYHAVYHLVDATDSSPSGFDGTDNGSTPASGVVGGARSFDGSGQHIDLGTERPFARSQSQLTVSAWALRDPAATESAVVFATSVDNGGTPTNTSRLQLLINTMGNLEGDLRTAESGSSDQVIGPAFETGRWQHLAFVADLVADTMTLYVDGTEVASVVPATLDDMTADSVSTQTVIGHGELFTVDAYFGSIDEVRLVHQARDADWIAATARSMSTGMVTIGPAEAIE